MRILVAGAGIGGLATALSLDAAGFRDVVVTEAVDEPAPLGVGINLLPHAVRELTELGLGDQLAELGVATAELAYFTRTGRRIWSEPRGLAVGYRWPQYSVHRGRLQMLLLDEVRSRMGPDAVRTGRRLTSVAADADGVTATFARGADERVDLLVGADGIRSTVRAQLHPQEPPPLWNGLVLWRGTTRARPYRGGRSMIMAGDGTDKFVAYPVGRPGADGLVETNWIAEQPCDAAAEAARGDWNRRVDPAEVAARFAEWRFDWLDVPALIGNAGAVYEYPMVDRDPLPRWTHGRVTLLGDAAHPMYPIGSNGASQAVLDARVLAHALAGHADPVAGAVAYEEQRRPPTTAIVLANRGMGPEVVLRMAAERAPDGRDLQRVLPRTELAAIAARYKELAGFDPALLNERASYDVTAVAGPTKV